MNMLITINSILHMVTDGICAFAMLGYFERADDGYFYILIYNFCAFALQMPFGFVLDLLQQKSHNKMLPYYITLMGVIFTVVGVWTHPVILGVGNALFHVGAGVCTIYEDNAENKKGKLLGIFVAPGALGLFLGKKCGKLYSVFEPAACAVIIVVTAFLALYLYKAYRVDRIGQWRFEERKDVENMDYAKAVILLLCFMVVILRSHVSMAVPFGIKAGATFGALLVVATVLGKMAGGFAGALLGSAKTVVLSLVAAAVCFAFRDVKILLLAAVFLFNMTMPITLYELVCLFKGFEGGMFGLLTFGLFIGFLPTYLNTATCRSGSAAAIESIVSMMLLLAALYVRKRPKERSMN